MDEEAKAFFGDYNYHHNPSGSFGFAVVSSDDMTVRWSDSEEDEDLLHDERLQHCPTNCQDPSCVRMHLCFGGNCRHFGREQDWLSSENFKRNRNKRFKTCKALSTSKSAYNTAYSAATSDRKRQKREEHELKTIPELDLSPEAKAVAVDTAVAAFDRKLAKIQETRPHGTLFSLNVYGASTGSEGYSIEQEGGASTLTTRGNDTPSIVAPSTNDRGWRVLDGPERKSLGPPGEEIFNTGFSKEMSKTVEKAVQLHAETLPNLKVLWRVAGAGAPKGLPPYKVGVRFVPHQANGDLPNGYFHTF